MKHMSCSVCDSHDIIDGGCNLGVCRHNTNQVMVATNQTAEDKLPVTATRRFPELILFFPQFDSTQQSSP